MTVRNTRRLASRSSRANIGLIGITSSRPTVQPRLLKFQRPWCAIAVGAPAAAGHHRAERERVSGVGLASVRDRKGLKAGSGVAAASVRSEIEIVYGGRVSLAIGQFPGRIFASRRCVCSAVPARDRARCVSSWA